MTWSKFPTSVWSSDRKCQEHWGVCVEMHIPRPHSRLTGVAPSNLLISSLDPSEVHSSSRATALMQCFLNLGVHQE